MTFRFSALASMLLAAAPALAEPATDAGAESLAESFRRYLGPVEGVVTVTPETDHYAVVLDLAPFIAMIPEAQAPGVDVSLSPLAFAMRDEGGGIWAVESDSAPTLQVTVPGKLTLALSAESLTYAGTYDEALSAFSQSQAEIGGLVLNETITDPTQGEMTVSYRIDTLRTESNAKAGLGGGVDLESRIDATGLAEQLSFPANPDMPIPLEFTLGAETYSVTQSGKALRTAELLNLWAWFVAHPSQAEIKGDFEAMKNAIAAALPLWDKIAMTGELQKVTVDTTFGSGAADSLGIELELSGLVAEGLFREKIAITGLALPAEVFPPWVPPLLPADVSIDVAVDGFDLAAPARILLDELTPDSKPDPSQEERLLKALLPDGAVRITLAPGGAERNDHAVNWEGTMTAGPGLLPVGSGVLVVRGMDAILTALNAAPADVSQGAVPALLMARGLAKPEDGDRLVWQFESDGQGKVTVNGLDLSGLAAQ